MKTILTVMLFLFGSSAQEYSKRVAVILRFTDPGDPDVANSATPTTIMSYAMHDLTTLAKGIYEQGLKFDRVIFMDGTDLTPESFKARLASLQNVGDLRVDVIGHGGLFATTSIPDPSVPSVTLSTERVQAMQLEDQYYLDGRRQVTWVATNVNESDDRYQDMARLLGYQKSDSTLFTANSFRDAIRAFHQKNQGVVSVNLLNCNSGAVAEALRKEPDTVVFANAPATEPSLVLEPTKASWQSSLSLYYEELSTAQGSISEARQKANEKFSRHLLAEYGKYGVIHIPRSPYYESIIGWCREQGEKRPAKLMQTHPKIPAFIAAQVELQTFKEALKSTPDSHSAFQDYIRSTEAQVYDECKDTVEQFNRRSNPYDQRIRRLNQEELARVDLNQQIGRLADWFLARLNESERPHLAARVREYFHYAARELQKVPRESWGVFGLMYDDIQSGELSDSALLKKLREAATQMKSACVDGDPRRRACKRYAEVARTIDELINSALPPPAHECDGFDFDCAGQGGKYAGRSVYVLWDTNIAPPAVLAKGPREHEAYCHLQAFHERERQQENLKLDETCFDDFESRADASEWQNLDRLWNLGHRSVADTRKMANGGAPAPRLEGTR